MGSLFEDIKNERSNTSRGMRSRISEILDTLKPEEQKDFVKALDDHSIPASNISRAMAKRGHKLSVSIISRYRRGELVTKIK